MYEHPITAATRKAQEVDYYMNLPEVGGVTGAILTVVFFLAVALFKLRKMGLIDKGEGDFYRNISEENTRLIERIRLLEVSRDECQNRVNQLTSDVTALTAQLAQINVLEMENTHLRERLNEKDEQIAQKNKQIEDMIDALMLKDNYILELTNRVHALELRLSADEKKFCMDCPRMSGAIGQ